MTKSRNKRAHGAARAERKVGCNSEAANFAPKGGDIMMDYQIAAAERVVSHEAEVFNLRKC